MVSNNTRVSVGVFQTEGPNVKDLPWPFAGTIRVTLLNQKLDDYHHERMKNVKHTATLTIVFSMLKYIWQKSLIR